MKSGSHERKMQADIEIGDDYYDVTFNRVTTYHTENYGADADGNRGVLTTFIDDDYAEDIFANDKPIEDLAPDLRKKIEEALERWIDKNEPEE